MRYIRRYLIVLLLCLAMAAACRPAYAGNAATKLGRGIANAAGGAYEIPRQIFKATDDGGPLSGVTVGLAKGVAFTIGRTLIGVYETATFLLPIPKGYEPILNPAYPFQTEPEFQF